MKFVMFTGQQWMKLQVLQVLLNLQCLFKYVTG